MTYFRVKEIAQAKGISMNGLVRMSDVSVITMRKLWRNDVPNYDPALSTLQKVAHALEVPLQELIVPDETHEPAERTRHGN